MPDPSTLIDRLSTGVPGLDTVLGGGLLKGGVYMVIGPPGGGKTILGNQVCFHRAAQGERAVYMTLLAESHSRMVAHLRTLSFFRPEIIPDRIHYFSAFKVLEEEGLSGLARVMRETLLAQKATLLVVDGIVSALEASPADRDTRKFIHEVQAIAGISECTAILLASNGGTEGVRPEHTMVDGIIELTDELTQLRSLRHLQVRKLRGAAPVRGKHTLVISNDGISVRPRIEASRFRLAEDAAVPVASGRVDFGIPGLDQMLRGGLPASSATMVLGPSGSGKTMLGLQFLAAGARNGESGLFFGFFERPDALLLKSQRIGFGLEDAHRQHTVEFLWQPSGEGSIDVLGERLLRTVREKRPKRLCVDGLQGFQQAVDAPERVRDVFSTIVEELEAAQVTTLYTMETPALFGAEIEAPIGGVSNISHNLILLRHVELSAHLYRLISILKVRDSDYDSAIREFRISDGGISVANTFESAQGILGGLAHSTVIFKDSLVQPPKREVFEPRPSFKAAGKPSILIVDDEFGLADVISDVLSDSGYNTSIAINGELGLAALREHKPALVLLDVMMPVLSGTEMLERMRRDPAHADIPVVLMTAVPEAVPKHQAGHIEAILHKPFTPDKLFEVLHRVLGAPAP
jgi:circadian clock protein KaiC